MKVTPGLLRKFLESEYEQYASNSDEWILPSFHNPHKLKLYINVAKGTGYDFISGTGYSSFDLIHELKGFTNKQQTIAFLQQFRLSNLRPEDLLEEVPERIPKKSEAIVNRIPLPEGTAVLKDLDLPAAKQAFSYLRARGLNKEDIARYHLRVGYEPGTEYYGRIIIPFIENGEMVWYQGRAMNKKNPLRYKNPKGVSKSMLVYNIDNMDKIAIITEGVFDAMTVNGMAIMGSSLSDWQAMKIIMKEPAGIVVCPDSDFQKDYRTGKIISVGYMGAVKSLEKLFENGYPLSKMYIAFNDDGKDLSDLGKSKAIESIYKAQPISIKTLMRLREKGADVGNLTKHL